MNIIVAIFGAILAIFTVVIIHELGHFIVARCMGVRVLRFSVGFGRPLWSKTTKKGTKFTIGWLPLGGYVRMLGEGDDAAPKDMEAFSYSKKNVFQRMAIVLAGPVMNFILAVVLYWILFLPGVVHIKPVIGQVKPNSIAAQAGLQPLDQITAINGRLVKNWRAVVMTMISYIGNKKPLTMTVIRPPKNLVKKVTLPIAHWKINERKPEFLRALGILPYRPKFPMIVGKIIPHSPAAQGGLQKGDRILFVDGKKYDDMLVLVQFVRQHPNKEMRFIVLRDGQQKRLTIKIGAKKSTGTGYLGFSIIIPKWPPSMLEREKFSVLTAWKPAVLQTEALIKFNGIVLGKMLLQKMSIRSLGGPISIFQMAGKASQQNYRVYIGFLAFLSVTLGFINLLPIPGLDGGHFFFQLIEFLFRRPVPMHIQAFCLRIGIILLILLILNATINDLSRLFASK